MNKTLQYAKKAYDEALSAKESSLRTEAAINEFIKEQLSHNNLSESSNAEFNVDIAKGTNRKKNFWYTVSIN